MNNQIRWVGLILVGMLLIFGLKTSPVQAATLTASDEASLVAAINSANANADFDIIELTADINLATTSTYNFDGATGLPIITKPLLIRGNGHTIRRTSSIQFRLLAANATQLWLENMTLAGGSINAAGGALYVNGLGASLTLLDVTVGGSESNRNQALSYGGGIYVNGDVSISQSNISYNYISAGNSYHGAGIYVRGSSTSSTSILQTEISYNTTVQINNSGYSAAGAVFIDGGNAYFIDSSTHHNQLYNSSTAGIGLYFSGSGNLYINGSTFDANTGDVNGSGYGSRGAVSRPVQRVASIFRQVGLPTTALMVVTIVAAA